MDQPDSLKVFISHRDSVCDECGEQLGPKSWVFLAGERGALCLACADLDHLVFLPSGDAAVSRRAKQHSRLHAVVLKWSRARKRYNSQIQQRARRLSSGLRGRIHELDSQKAVVDQLGRDFCFVGEQYLLQVGGRDFRLDLLFYHSTLQCLVAEYQTRLPDKKLLERKLHEFYQLALPAPITNDPRSSRNKGGKIGTARERSLRANESGWNCSSPKRNGRWLPTRSDWRSFLRAMKRAHPQVRCRLLSR